MAADAHLSALVQRWLDLKSQGKPVSVADVCADCPEMAEALERHLQDVASMESFLGPETKAGNPGHGAPSLIVPPTRFPNDEGSDVPIVSAAITIPGYEVLEELGRGGMGVVYKARQVRLDRAVALKIIRPERLTNQNAVRRFQREAKAAARLSHPNIVAIHDAAQAASP